MSELSWPGRDRVALQPAAPAGEATEHHERERHEDQRTVGRDTAVPVRQVDERYGTHPSPVSQKVASIHRGTRSARPAARMDGWRPSAGQRNQREGRTCG